MFLKREQFGDKSMLAPLQQDFTGSNHSARRNRRAIHVMNLLFLAPFNHNKQFVCHAPFRLAEKHHAKEHRMQQTFTTVFGPRKSERKLKRQHNAQD